jgi:hypothetical protein
MDKIPPNRRAESTSRGSSRGTSRGTSKGTSRGTTDSMKRCTSASTPDPPAPVPHSRLALWTVRRWWDPPRSLWTWDTSHRWVYQGQFSQVGVCDGQFPQVGVSGTETVLTGGVLIDSSQRFVHQERSYLRVYQEGFLAQVGVCKRFLELNMLGRGFTGVWF